MWMCWKEMQCYKNVGKSYICTKMLEIQQHIDTGKSAGDMNVLRRVYLIIYSLITQKSITGTEPLDI